MLVSVKSNFARTFLNYKKMYTSQNFLLAAFTFCIKLIFIKIIMLNLISGLDTLSL